ncbi:hypothetical protein TRV_06078 [Trichophyton verrucosum HKI 0517]|uniref:Secreted protein n=1 Tax=Trichophyton verrucosum (strain HKI 0517) TaxID=663202 RepID=D4DFX5_TRIVH|nr:uncharacterized protein TRV_06078 [Trichophyton verrucosum HKI 0517]EFE39256.1 hypothetical protein TRV_06078 [Trichophyton verrucosum HKI 0517]
MKQLHLSMFLFCSPLRGFYSFLLSPLRFGQEGGGDNNPVVASRSSGYSGGIRSLAVSFPAFHWASRPLYAHSMGHKSRNDGVKSAVLMSDVEKRVEVAKRHMISSLGAFSSSTLFNEWTL